MKKGLEVHTSGRENIVRKERKKLNNFDFCVPTEIIFGKKSVNKLKLVIERYGHNVLFVYGGGSIKENGIYQDIMEELGGVSVVELSGVQSNPDIDKVREGVEAARASKVDVILAAGGGSVIDSAKLIAAGYYYDDDLWDLVLSPGDIKEALPVVAFVTVAGTGSEMNGSIVITNEETKEKLGATSPFMQPKVALIDPEYTYSVSARQTALGIADIMSHAIEYYFTKDEDTYIQNGFAEQIMKTCIKYAECTLNEPENYEARANLLLASTLAQNGILGCGKRTTWACHPMEHELSVNYNIAHGEGMAILLPRWMQYIVNDKTLPKFVSYAKNVWNLADSEDQYSMASKAIACTKEFFEKCGIFSTLQELGIDDSHFEEMAKSAVRNGYLMFAYVPLKAEDVVNIYNMCL